jgi:5-methylcytosine-specific restriction protein B
MQLNLERFEELIETYAKPRWEKQIDEWELRPGGGEMFAQRDVLEKASPCLDRDWLEKNPKENLLKVIGANNGLLAIYEGSFARLFVGDANESELSSRIVGLVYGANPLEERLRIFLEWSKVELTSESGKKSGINGTVCSYLLAMANPSEYSFCKPSVYEFFVKNLLDWKERKVDPIERILHCREIYRALLEYLERVHGLEKGNLLDVHTLGFMFKLLENKVDEGVQYWTFSPGKNASLFQDFFENGIMAIGWDKLGDLTQYQSKLQIQNALSEIYNYGTKPSNRALACYEFCQIMKKGDYIFAKKGRKEIVGVGVVDSEYYFDEERTEKKNVRGVKWLRKGAWPIEVDTPALKTLTNVTQYKDFVQKILELTETPESTINTPPGGNFWWLNANPKIWNFIEIPVGEKQIYTAYNKKGNKRRIFKHFEAVAPGDTIIGYVASPNREIVAECRVTRGLHDTVEGLGIEFEKTEQFLETLSFEKLKAMPELRNCEPLKNNQGSLFKLTSSEYDVMRSMLEERNPENEIQPYSIKEGLKFLFVSDEKFHHILDRIKLKKNLVLQGPPGVGKTFIARHIAYALTGVVDKRRVTMIQFHQSYSYEDFMQGFRPNSDGKFDLRNGAFYDFCRKAQRDLANPYVFIIDEINRGNLSKIFGEMFMLIEADKRGPDYAMPLTYAQGLDDTFYIPDNIYIIGTMNTADRSLAMVDYALRRRFCFINLAPAFKNQKFRDFLVNAKVEAEIIDKIIDRMGQLNQRIAEDQKNLGRGYCVGHSYFCTSDNNQVYGSNWYENVIRTEIEPLLEEYWFDDPDKFQKRVDQLF